MVQAVIKNKLASWYRSTAKQHIRPVDLDGLTSKRYREKSMTASTLKPLWM
jgi:hypothetical protein